MAKSTAQKAKQINQSLQNIRFQIDFALESARSSHNGFRNIFLSPRLPSGVPAGHFEKKAAVRPQK
jgi:hypothetical protein